MCGRYRRIKDTQLALQGVFGPDVANWPFQFRKYYNAAPTQSLPVVVSPDPGKATLAHFTWGLIPPWARDARSGYSTINARVETAAEKRTFASPYQSRHCLVVADGWYEWRVMDGSKKPVKQPYMLTLPGEDTFCFAGLWETWKPRDSEPVHSFTILTTDAGRHIRMLHDRMPIIVPQEHWQSWLAIKGKDATTELLHQHILPAAHELEPEIVPVSREVGKPAFNQPEAVEPLPIDASLDLKPLERVLDAIEHISKQYEDPAPASDIRQISGLPQGEVLRVLDELVRAERIIAAPRDRDDGGSTTGYILATSALPDQVPPLNPL